MKKRNYCYDYHNHHHYHHHYWASRDACNCPRDWNIHHNMVLCISRSSNLWNIFSHWWQDKGRAFLLFARLASLLDNFRFWSFRLYKCKVSWLFSLWFSRVCFSLNRIPHCLQASGSFPLWFLWWILNEKATENTFSHWSQGYEASEWVLLWVLRLPRWLKDKSQSSQG